MVTLTVWERSTLSQVRRMWQRGQSPHITGQHAGGSGGPSMGGEVSTWLEGIGQKTALTRRGLMVRRFS